MVKIAPSILSADFRNLAGRNKRCGKGEGRLDSSGYYGWSFCSQYHLWSDDCELVRLCTKLPLDVHLMIENPDLYLEKFVEAGADYLTVHLEGNRHLHWTLTRIKSLGVKNGCVLNPATPFCLVKPNRGD